jgi:hypothetical protein
MCAICRAQLHRLIAAVQPAAAQKDRRLQQPLPGAVESRLPLNSLQSVQKCLDTEQWQSCRRYCLAARSRQCV